MEDEDGWHGTRECVLYGMPAQLERGRGPAPDQGPGAPLRRSDFPAKTRLLVQPPPCPFPLLYFAYGTMWHFMICFLFRAPEGSDLIR